MFILKKEMASKRDVHFYCNAKENESKRSGISIPEIIITAKDNASPVEVYMARE